MAKKNPPALKPKRSRKERLSVEIEPSNIDKLRRLSEYMKAKNYDASMAKLVDQFVEDGVKSLMKTLGIDEIPEIEKPKPIPAKTRR